MQRSTVWWSWLIPAVWVLVIAGCLLAGLTGLAIVVLLAPGVIFVLGLVGLRLYWQRHPEHRRIGDWFTEEHHIRHW
jgi:hypothetical protein